MSFSKDAIPALSVVDSPVEGKLVQSMFDLWDFVGYDRWSFEAMESSRMTLSFYRDEYHIGVALQVKLKSAPRRYDMLIKPSMAAMFAVEVDGIEYHSSRESFIRDRRNDRRSLLSGIKVARFAGPEVYENPSAVANEIIELCERFDFMEQEEWDIAWNCGKNSRDAARKWLEQ